MRCSSVFTPLLALTFGVLMPVEPVLADEGRSPGTQAGWGQIEITPPPGIALGGRGGPDTLADKVLDPLYAQVLFLKDGRGTGFALVSLDVVGISHELSDRLRTALVHELGVDYNLAVVNCSHTHSGPYMYRELMAGLGAAPKIETEYHDALVPKVIEAARNARKQLKPVSVESFRGASRFGVNRRGKAPNGKIAGMRPDPNGPINETLWVLKLAPADGSPAAFVFSYSCHPVIVYTYANSALSADFPGLTRSLLREKLGAAHVQFVQGTAGNIRPRVLADSANGRFRAGKPEDLQQAAGELAENVLAATKGGGRMLQLHLAGASDRPFLPRDNPPPRAVYEKMAEEAKKGSRRDAAEYWLKRYDSGEGFAKGDAWPLGLVRLADDEWICHFAGEPCAEWAGKVKTWLGGRNVVVWGYSQEALAYLPTEAMLPEGGYEVDESNRNRTHTPAPFAPGIENAIRDSLKRQLAFIEAR
jgi:neutral ceramidase